MWWSQEEEDLQKRYIVAWGEAADDDLADLAADPPDLPDGDFMDAEGAADLDGDLAALEDGMAGLLAGPEEPGPGVGIPAIPWHVPEDVPFPAFEPELPLVNGFHIHLPPLNHPPNEAG
jgi:hypothetical protein